jgi:hypothetical protein
MNKKKCMIINPDVFFFSKKKVKVNNFLLSKDHWLKRKCVTSSKKKEREKKDLLKSVGKETWFVY